MIFCKLPWYFQYYFCSSSSFDGGATVLWYYKYATTLYHLACWCGFMREYWNKWNGRGFTFPYDPQPQPIDPLLKQCIGDFLRTLQDTDLTVRRVALVTFNSAAHNKPSLIRDLLETVLPHLYNETKVRVNNVLFILLNCTNS